MMYPPKEELLWRGWDEWVRALSEEIRREHNKPTMTFAALARSGVLVERAFDNVTGVNCVYSELEWPSIKILEPSPDPPNRSARRRARKLERAARRKGRA